MRERKLRAWDKTNKRMYYVDFDDLLLSVGSQSAGDYSLVDQVGEEIAGFVGGKHDQHRDDMEYMEWTGLKDKDNKEIYEGDIVQRGYFALNDISKFGLDPWLHLPEGVQESDITTVIETWTVENEISDWQKISEAVRSNPDVLGVEIIGNIYEATND